MKGGSEGAGCIFYSLNSFSKKLDKGTAFEYLNHRCFFFSQTNHMRAHCSASNGFHPIPSQATKALQHPRCPPQGTCEACAETRSNFHWLTCPQSLTLQKQWGILNTDWFALWDLASQKRSLSLFQCVRIKHQFAGLGSPAPGGQQLSPESSCASAAPVKPSSTCTTALVCQWLTENCFSHLQSCYRC